MDYLNEKTIIFLDNIQRTIVATLKEDTPTYIKVTKPVILNVAPEANKKLQVQLYPLLFREFTKDRDSFPVWTYSKTNIAIASNVELENNLLKQYHEMFKIVKNDPAPTIKLFDADEKK